MAFYGCSALTTISIPQEVTSIGTDAYSHCTSLTNINLPEGLTSIGSGALSYCIGLTNISIPLGVTSIGNEAFYGCAGLTTIRFNSATTTIYNDAATIPAETKIIGYASSFAKDYATKYYREFNVIVPAPDTTGMIEMKTTSPMVGPSKVWTIRLNGIVNEVSLKDKIYITNSQGVKQIPTWTVISDNGVSKIEVRPNIGYTPDDYILWVGDIENVKGTKLKNSVFLKFTVR